MAEIVLMKTLSLLLGWSGYVGTFFYVLDEFTDGFLEELLQLKEPQKTIIFILVALFWVLKSIFLLRDEIKKNRKK